MVFKAKKFGPRWKVYAPNGNVVATLLGDQSYVTGYIKNKYNMTEFLGEYLEADNIIVEFEEEDSSQEPETPQEENAGFENNNKDPLGRWEPMPDHHGIQFMEGKQTSVITPEGYPDDGNGGNSFVFVVKNKEDNTEERYPCMDEAAANQKKALFEERFKSTMEQMWSGGDMPMPSIDDKYTLEIVQNSPVSQQQESTENTTQQEESQNNNSQQSQLSSQAGDLQNVVGNNISSLNSSIASQQSQLSSQIGDSQKAVGDTVNSLSNSIGSVQSQLSSKLENPQEILAIKTAEIAQKAFEDNVMSLGDCIAIKEDLNIEDVTQKAVNEMNESSNKLMSSALSGMSGAMAKIGEYSEKITQQGTDQINKLAGEGSDYCNKQKAALQEAANKRVSQAKAVANNALNMEITTMAAASGLQKGLQMANEVNAKIQEQAAKLVNEKKKLEAAAKTKAEAALQAAKLAIMALTGISL